MEYTVEDARKLGKIMDSKYQEGYKDGYEAGLAEGRKKKLNEKTV